MQQQQWQSLCYNVVKNRLIAVTMSHCNCC